MQVATAVYSPAQPIKSINENSAQYSCCCCNVRTGALIVAIISLIEAIAVMIPNGDGWGRLESVNEMIEVADEENEDLSSPLETELGFIKAIIIVSIIIYAIQSATIFVLFVGWAKEMKYLLIPFIVLQVLEVLYTFAMGLTYIISVIVNNVFAKLLAFIMFGYISEGQTVSSGGAIACVFCGIGFLFNSLFEIWFFTIVFRCFRLFQDKEQAASVGGAAPVIQFSAAQPFGGYCTPKPSPVNGNPGVELPPQPSAGYPTVAEKPLMQGYAMESPPQFPGYINKEPSMQPVVGYMGAESPPQVMSGYPNVDQPPQPPATNPFFAPI